LLSRLELVLDQIATLEHDRDAVAEVPASDVCHRSARRRPSAARSRKEKDHDQPREQQSRFNQPARRVAIGRSAWIAFDDKTDWAQAGTDPVVLITGTSTGFGRLMAEEFVKNGARVIATMRDLSGKNAAAAQELRSLTDFATPIEGVEIDVLSHASVASGVARAIESAGHIDILVSNAGIVVPGPV
jgi:hypothetical protein